MAWPPNPPPPPSRHAPFPNKTSPAKLDGCVDAAPAQLDEYVVTKAPAQLDGYVDSAPAQLDACVVAKAPTQLDGYVVAEAPAHLDGCVVAKAPAQIDGRVVAKSPTHIDGRAGVEESKARNPNGDMSRRTLNAIVAALRAYRYMAMLLYCAFLFHFVWMAASRA